MSDVSKVLNRRKALKVIGAATAVPGMILSSALAAANADDQRKSERTNIMFYAVIARDKPNGLEQRMALRDIHFAYINSLGQKVVFAGALFGDDDRMDGSLMVVEAASLEEAKTLAAGDPFVVQGLYASYEVKRWTFAHNNVAGRRE